MKADCIQQLSFTSLESKKIVASFDGGKITSDAGCLLLREIDDRAGIISLLNQAIKDPRMPGKVLHDQETLLRQRIFAIALGYEDANDHDALKQDPALKTAARRLPDSARDLASQPTLSRLENRSTRSQIFKMSKALLDAYVSAHPGHRNVIVIDIDSTDDPTHGQQEFSFFHGYHDRYMFHPVVIFDGISGFPMAAVLRPGNAHASKGAASILKRIIRRLRRTYPKATILLRADAGFAVPSIYRLLEKLKVRYTIGLITNNRLKDRVETLAESVNHAFNQTGQKQREFASFRHQAQSWERSRRVVAKAEYSKMGANTRFVVTNIGFESPSRIYDDIYLGRCDAENRIKELKNHLKADRTSCHVFLANQFRLLLHAFAFALMWHLRQSAAGTELACASFETLRLKLLKIGARVKESCRRVTLSMTSSYPYKDILTAVLDNIQAMPLRV